MTQEIKPPKELAGQSQPAILALANTLYEMGKAQIAAGKPVSQQEMAILNNARRALKRQRPT